MRIQVVNNHFHTSSNVNFKNKVSPKTIKKALNYMTIGALALTPPTCVHSYNKISEEMNERFQYVTPAKNEFCSKEDAINYAKDRIAEYLNKENPLEYGVTIGLEKNGTYKILCENIGTPSSVTNTTLDLCLYHLFGINKPQIHLHGHPIDNDPPRRVGTQTFSFQDFKSFNSDFNCKETIVINKDKQDCILIKKDNYKQLDEVELAKLEEEFLKAFNSSWSNKVDIVKDGKIIHSIRDYQAMHKFWDGVAKKYNLEYKTTYGFYDGIDAYEKSYNPELEDLEYIKD